MRDIAVVALALHILDGMAGVAAQQLPRTIDPGIIQQRFERPAEPRSMPRILIPYSERCPQVPDLRFELRGIVLDGVTRYREAELASLWLPLLSRTVDVCDIFTIAASVADKYVADGNPRPAIAVPAQEVVEGVIRLRVREGAKN